MHYAIRLLLMRLKSEDYEKFFKFYKTPQVQATVEKFADMDFPIRLVLQLMKNTKFRRFLIHICFKNLGVFPKLIKILFL